MVRWFCRFRANTEREGRKPRRGTRHEQRARGGHGVMVDVEKSASRDLVSRAEADQGASGVVTGLMCGDGGGRRERVLDTGHSAWSIGSAKSRKFR